MSAHLELLIAVAEVLKQIVSERGMIPEYSKLGYAIEEARKENVPNMEGIPDG